MEFSADSLILGISGLVINGVLDWLLASSIPQYAIFTAVMIKSARRQRCVHDQQYISSQRYDSYTRCESAMSMIWNLLYPGSKPENAMNSVLSKKDSQMIFFIQQVTDSSNIKVYIYPHSVRMWQREVSGVSHPVFLRKLPEKLTTQGSCVFLDMTHGYLPIQDTHASPVSYHSKLLA